MLFRSTIAIDASIHDLKFGGSTSDLIIGSALGSALGQIGFVLGLVGLMIYLTLPRQIIYRHGSIMIGALIILALVGIDGNVSRSEGATLITIYVMYAIFLFTEKTSAGSIKQHEMPLTTSRSWLYLIVGFAIIVIGAELTVKSATHVAELLEVNQSFIAIIVVGLGTSLPELSISVSAAMKKKSGLSVGNLIGSNIFDTLVPIGAAATIATLKFDQTMLRFDLPFLLVLSATVLIVFMRKKGLQKKEAALILALYCGYALVRISKASLA